MVEVVTILKFMNLYFQIRVRFISLFLQVKLPSDVYATY